MTLEPVGNISKLSFSYTISSSSDPIDPKNLVYVLRDLLNEHKKHTAWEVEIESNGSLHLNNRENKYLFHVFNLDLELSGLDFGLKDKKIEKKMTETIQKKILETIQEKIHEKTQEKIEKEIQEKIKNYPDSSYHFFAVKTSQIVKFFKVTPKLGHDVSYPLEN